MLKIKPAEPVLVPCTKCQTPTNPTNMIDALSISPRRHPRDEDTATRAQLCLPCWSLRGRTPRAPEPERAPEPHPFRDYSVSKHPNAAAAAARGAQVREYLGMGAVTEIVALSGARLLDPSEPCYLIGDSPLVPGAKLIKNPFK
jgi:hypothetical protein